MLKLLNLQTPAKTGADQPRKVESLPIVLIKPNPYQPRKDFSAHGLEELAQSIREYGILQPITVRKSSSGGYELIAGERRLRASKLLGLETIPALVINSYEQDSAMMAMIENLQRENLHYMEEAKGYASLIHDHGFTQEQLAQKLGKSQSTVANKLRILKLSAEVKEILIDYNLTERHARALLKLPDPDLQCKVIRQAAAKGLTVKDTEILVDRCIRAFEVRSAQQAQKSGRKLLKRTKDVRVFVNTIRQAVTLMKEYGLSPQYAQEEKEDHIEIKLIIPKG